MGTNFASSNKAPMLPKGAPNLTGCRMPMGRSNFRPSNFNGNGPPNGGPASKNTYARRNNSVNNLKVKMGVSPACVPRT